jgi:hypothetical protein
MRLSLGLTSTWRTLLAISLSCSISLNVYGIR